MTRPARRLLALISDPARAIDLWTEPLENRIKVFDDNDRRFETWTTWRVMDELAAAGHVPSQMREGVAVWDSKVPVTADPAR